MNKIGKRVVKTAVAIFISVFLYLILMQLDYIYGLDRNVYIFAPTNWYTPFFAGIAAGYAVQNNPERSHRQAQIRSFGSLIGGIYGAIIIHIYEEAYLLFTNSPSIDAFQNNIIFKLLEFVFVSLGVLLLIPLTVKLKRSNAVFISILTYLSVTISIRNGGMDVFFFAFNRILSTIVGVEIALLVNSIDSIKHKNKEILFVSSLDSSKMNKQAGLSGFMIYEINNLSNRGCDIVFSNDRTLNSISPFLKDIKVNTPAYLLNGLITYDNSNRKYTANKEINPLKRSEIETILNNAKIAYFTYQVDDFRFSCYYKELSNEAIKKYYDDRISSTHYSFSRAIAPEDMGVSLYYCIDKESKINEVKNKLLKLSFKDEIDIVIEPSLLEGYKELKIRPASINSTVLIKELYNKLNKKYLISFVSKDTKDEQFKISDFTFCLDIAPNNVKEKVNYVIKSTNPNCILKFFYKIYFKKDYIKYLNKIKIR